MLLLHCLKRVTALFGILAMPLSVVAIIYTISVCIPLAGVKPAWSSVALALL
jgi:hypothetical protein